LVVSRNFESYVRGCLSLNGHTIFSFFIRLIFFELKDLFISLLHKGA
jgi:hypothetical protein